MEFQVKSNLGNIICFNLLVYSEYCSSDTLEPQCLKITKRVSLRTTASGASFLRRKKRSSLRSANATFGTNFAHYGLPTFVHRNASSMQPKPHTWMQKTRDENQAKILQFAQQMQRSWIELEYPRVGRIAKAIFANLSSLWFVMQIFWQFFLVGNKRRK